MRSPPGLGSWVRRARKHAAATTSRGARRRQALVVELGEVGGEGLVVEPAAWRARRRAAAAPCHGAPELPIIGPWAVVLSCRHVPKFLRHPRPKRAHVEVHRYGCWRTLQADGNRYPAPVEAAERRHEGDFLDRDLRPVPGGLCKVKHPARRRLLRGTQGNGNRALVT